MATWGTGSFESDSATDFLTELLQSDGLAYLEEKLQTGVDAPEGTLEEAEGAQAVAAAEVVARLRGHPPTGTQLRPDLAKWVESHTPMLTPALTALALRALDRVVQPPSELLAVWSEAPGKITWHAALADVRARLA